MTAINNQYDCQEKTQQPIDQLIKEVLADFPQVCFAIVFGSVALGRPQLKSDLDIAIAENQPLTANEKMNIISALAARIGRPVIWLIKKS
jgi:predicted nucleotidyltransferase